MSDAARLGFAEGAGWEALTDSVVTQLGGPEPGSALGLVYTADVISDSFADIVDRLKRQTGVRHWVGTVGYGVVATGREIYDRPALAAMILPMAEDAFRIITPAEEDEDTLEGHGAWIARNQPSLGLFHAAASAPNLLQDLVTLGETVGCFVVGGLTASREAAVTVADRVAADTLSGVMFAGTVPVATAIAQGCAPAGPPHRVTAADRNVVFELDGEPALQVLYRDLGVSDVAGLRQYADVLNAALPVENSDRNEYLVRNVIGVDPGRELIVVGDVMTPGSTLLFCRRERDTAVADMRTMLEDLRGRLPGQPRAAVYVTCVARGPNLFGEQSEEVGLIREMLGPVPLIGFFANGEIFNGRLHGYTGVLTMFC